jgi:hypothetical protein
VHEASGKPRERIEQRIALGERHCRLDDCEQQQTVMGRFVSRWKLRRRSGSELCDDKWADASGAELTEANTRPGVPGLVGGAQAGSAKATVQYGSNGAFPFSR